MAMPLRWKAPPPGGGHPARHRRGGAAQPQLGFRAPSSRWALTSAGTPGALTFSAATRSGMELGTGRHPLARSSANAGVPGQFLLRRRDDLRSWAHPAVAPRPGRPDCSSSSSCPTSAPTTSPWSASTRRSGENRRRWRALRSTAAAGGTGWRGTASRAPEGFRGDVRWAFRRHLRRAAGEPRSVPSHRNGVDHRSRAESARGGGHGHRRRKRSVWTRAG